MLNTISSDDPIAADVALDENLIPFIEKEYRDNKLIADSIFTLTLSDQTKYAVALVDRAEYKRRQAPPGVRLRPKAFGRDRRTPITNRWRS